MAINERTPHREYHLVNVCVGKRRQEHYMGARRLHSLFCPPLIIMKAYRAEKEPVARRKSEEMQNEGERVIQIEGLHHFVNTNHLQVLLSQVYTKLAINPIGSLLLRHCY